MDAVSCSDCGQSLEPTTERHIRLPAPAGDGRPPADGAADATATILCVVCGIVRLNSDPSVPADAVEVHAPTGARR